MFTLKPKALNAVVGALALALAVGGSARAGEIYAIGPTPGTAYTSLIQFDTQGKIQATNAIGANVGGGFFAPYTEPLVSVVAENGSLFSIGSDPGTPYTEYYQTDLQGKFQSSGAIAYDLGGGLSLPLSQPLVAATYGSGEVYAIGPTPGTAYTSLFAFDTTGVVQSSNAVGYDVGGGFFAPLTQPLTSIAYAGGDIFAIGPEAGTAYTALYELTDAGKIIETGAIGYDVGGGYFAPLTQPLTSIAFGDGGLYAVGPTPGTAYTSLFRLDTFGQIESSGSVGYDVGGGFFAPLTQPIAAIAFVASPAPEPSAWALLIGGVAAIGSVLRGRRRGGREVANVTVAG